MTEIRYVTDERERFSLYRLCPCEACEGSGKALSEGLNAMKCPECRGEGRIRQEVATVGSPEAIGVALVTLAREGEFADCPFGLLDRTAECETCEGSGCSWVQPGSADSGDVNGVTSCPTCKGSGVKPTGTWLLLPWLPSARNVSDAARTLARSKKPRRGE